MDEFAQTRGVDDLFDDEIIPVAPSEIEVEYTDDIAPYDPPQPESITPTPPQDTTHFDRNAGQYRRRGNGRGRGPRGGVYTRGSKSTGNGNRDNNNKQEEGGEPTSTATVTPTAPVTNHESGGNQSDKEATPVSGTEAAEADDADAQSKEPVKPKVPAVRGDRSGTGGVKKPKLTEEELSQRMAAAKIAAAKRAAAHARAEADEASFHERERVAAVKRVQERQNHRAMVGERERNRQRKLQAQTGREWDAEKSEDTFGDRQRGGSTYRRGMHGGVVAAGDSRRAEDPAVDGGDAEFNSQWHRGRGGRGVRGGRGRGQGRGGRGRGGNGGGGGARSPTEHAASDIIKSPPPIAAESEFPALPGNNNNDNKKDSSAPAVNTAQPATAATLETPISPMPLQGSWADHEDELHEAQAAKKAAQPV